MQKLRWHSERLVNSMARKKIVYVIVEGPSDDEALDVILTRLYDKNTVYVEITHGDITSERGIISTNIVARIGDLVKSYADSMHFHAEDFKEIIHIVDMDGAYISEEYVVEDAAAEKPYYTLTEIRTARPKQIKDRNKRKSKNLDGISCTSRVWNVPYKVYYMSCNLDHVLYNKLNSTDDDKENDAYRFAKKYKDNLDAFLTFISDSDFSWKGTYKESWNYIRKNLHSLERNSNLGLCFENIRKKRNT